MFGNYPEQQGQGWFQRSDVGPGLIDLGLSILANNDGRMSNGQLIANGGLDALANIRARRRYEAAMARQQMQDEQAQQAHDLQMRRGQMEMDEATQRADLMQRWMNGDQSVYKYLFPLQYLQDQRQARDHAHALKVAAMNEAKNNSKYVDGVGMVDKNGVVTPLTDPSGQPYMTPKERKEQIELEKREKALANQKKLALQTGKTQLDAIGDALDLTEGSSGYFNTGLLGKAQSVIPWTPGANLESKLDTIGSGVMLHSLEQLKMASPTGASGFGNLTEKEGKAIRDAQGSLSTWQSPEELRKSLENIKNMYISMLTGWGYTPEEIEALFKREAKKKATMGDTVLSAKDGGGSYASASDHADALIKKYTQR